MSATNRGKERIKNDFYSTPREVIENLLLNHLNLNNYGCEVLEPSAGDGVFIDVINEFYNKNIDCVEIREEEKEKLESKCQDVIIGDFLNLDTNKKYDVIIGNPPYTYALEFVNKSLELLKDDGVLIFLLRTAFLESKKRYHFWQENPVS